MKNYSIKFILRKDKLKKDGTYPIALRLIYNRRPYYVTTKHSIAENNWDDENGLLVIDNQVSNVNKYLLNLLKTVIKRIDPFFNNDTQNILVIKHILAKTVKEYDSFSKSMDLQLKGVLNNLNLVVKPGVTGVYFLLCNSEIIYIGQTSNLFKRLAYHLSNKDFDCYAFFPCPKDELNFMEAKLIREFSANISSKLQNKILF